jgi:hypothetical protein
MLHSARLALVLATALAAVALTGCGSGSASGGSDPASVIPADASIYLQASVRPQGSLRGNALAAAGKVLHTSDPQGTIRGWLDKALASSKSKVKLSYDKDIAPWLGEKAGLWVDPSSVSGSGTASATSGGQGFRGVVVLQATDADKARQALYADDGTGPYRKKTYNGVEYQLNSEGTAAGIVGGFAVAGTEAEFKRAIAASKGGSLAEADGYKQAVAKLAPGRLGQFYVNTKAIVDSLGARDPAIRQQIQQLGSVFSFDKYGPIAGSFSADGDKLALDTLTTTSGATDQLKRLGLFGAGGATKLVGELPGDSWAAYGVAGFGQSAKALFGQAMGGLGEAAIAQQLRSQLGIDLDQDVFSWMGDLAGFVRGTTKDTVDGGLVIGVTDQGKAATAFGKLIGVLRTRGGVDATPVRIEGAETAFQVRQPGAPKPIVLARSADRVVVAYGQAAAAEAFSPRSKLADSDTYGAANSVLGDGYDPTVLVSMPEVVTLIESAAGGGSGAAGFAKAKPYLEAFGVIATGSKVADGTARSRVAAQLR